MRVELQPAFILHSRPFRDTSLIADCFSLEYGRMSLLAKGARSAKSKQKNYLQPFTPITVSWQGKSSLKTLTSVEASGAPNKLEGNYLYSGFYLNELLVRLLPEHEANPEIFELYKTSLMALANQQSLEIILRLFEEQLLQQLGYEINFTTDTGLQAGIKPGQLYRFHPEQGFDLLPLQARIENDVFSGELILDIAAHRYDNEVILSQAKRLMRLALKPLLGNKPLQSRKLFVGMTSSS